MQSFGERLAEKRSESDISIVKLADEIGVSDQTIRNWESNKFKPGMENIELLCRVFKVDITYFLGSSEQCEKAEASAANITAEEVAAAVSNKLAGVTTAIEENSAAVNNTAQAVHDTAQAVDNTAQKVNRAVFKVDKTVFVAAIIGACIFAFLAAIGLFLCVYTGTSVFSKLAIGNFANSAKIGQFHLVLAIFFTSVSATLTVVLSIFAAKIKKSSPPRERSLESGSLLTNP